MKSLRHKDKVKIVDIVFAYDRRELLHLLSKRGGYIARQNWDKVSSTEAEI